MLFCSSSCMVSRQPLDASTSVDLYMLVSMNTGFMIIDLIGRLSRIILAIEFVKV